VSVTVELFVPDTELVPVRDVVEEGVAVVEDDADFVTEDVALGDEERVVVLVVVVVAEGVVVPVDDLELVGEDVDVTEDIEVFVTDAVPEDVCVLMGLLLTVVDAVVVKEGNPVLVSVGVTVDVLEPKEEVDGVDVPVLVFEVEVVAEDVADDVVEGDVVVVEVLEELGLLVLVILGEHDAVVEGGAVALIDVDPDDVFDVVPEALPDPLAMDDFVEERVANPDG
jgi:hypothetical protein